MKIFPVLLVLFTLGAAASLPAGAASCTLPAAPTMAGADATFNGYFTQNGPGWTGADGTYSMVLPDGTNLWMWSDSYLGTVDPVTRLRSNSLFGAHNSLTILNTLTGSLTTVGYPANTKSYFVPTIKANWFWVADGYTTQPSPGVYKINIVLLEWNNKIKLQGASVATLSWPSLTIDSITSIAGFNKTIEWGTRILQDGGFYYIYGLKDLGATKQPYLARITDLSLITDIANWSFFNGKSWVAGETNARPLGGVAGVTPEYNVFKMTANTGPFYLMTGMDNITPAYPLWSNLTTYYSCNPQGPWSKKTTVFVAPEAGANGCSTGTLVTYNAKAHPEFADATGILASYNINANNSKDLVCADDYRPKFARFVIPGLTLSPTKP